MPGARSRPPASTGPRTVALDGNVYTFPLRAGTKILPAERAASLGVGSHVTVIAPRDPSTVGWTATGIVVQPPKP